ncbi:MAG: RusA family crossover junction endodeoxyribonuclease [archaeon]|nr:RusA family crossover junction endodeoxyribonuclease [archaeon]
MAKNKFSQRTVKDNYYFLEEKEGERIAHSYLIAVKTSEMAETIRKIREGIITPQNKEFMVGKLLDVAIVVHVNKQRYDSQDVDNVAKVVLDALKKNKNFPDESYLFGDDSHVIRLLVQKVKRTEDNESETDQLSISIREHNSEKDMKIVKSE